MFTRKQYMSHEVDHDTYHLQFVTLEVLCIVKQHIGMRAIMQSKDPHMNDIMLSRWDALEPMLRPWVINAVRAADDSWSLGTAVCIAKAAARKLKQEETQS